MTTKPDLAESHRRLYSAAARMLWVQGDPVWRGDFWPPERARSWRDLEACLSAVPTGDAIPPGPLDPARHLASRRTPEGHPIPFGDAVRAWEARLDADPGPSGAPDDGGPSGPALVLDDARRSAVVALLAELDERLAPGRPGHPVAQDAADLAQAVCEAADSLRLPLAPDGAGTAPATAPPLGTAAAPSARVAEADRARLRDAARAALRTVPGRADAVENGDFSIRIAACDAAADLARVDEDDNTPEWREPRTGVDPGRHLVHAYRWGPGEARPLSFPELAGDLRALHAEAPPPRLLGPDDPPPGDLAEGGTRTVLSREAALVAAELLEELAARLAPGARAGTIHFTAYPVHLFLKGRFQRAFTAG
ncbi:hypothetical protein ACFOVU_18060 [Nocardiopsis sediminis]|uniref:Uncharacterized protein n=1 Tax=Nocardiopsis sediminis TaxID=1778267 RepID=A0ABV8FT73_9ACTN